MSMANNATIHLLNCCFVFDKNMEPNDLDINQENSVWQVILLMNNLILHGRVEGFFSNKCFLPTFKE